VPESWTTRAPEGEEVWLDPRREHRRFRELQARLALLRSLPAASLEGLLQASPGGGRFAEVLRQLVLVLALDLEHLAVAQEEVSRFRQTCFTAGKMFPAVRDKVCGLFAAHLEKTMPAGRENGALIQALAAQIDALEQAAPEKLPGLFIAASS
jgi:hypothetical protein